MRFLPLMVHLTVLSSKI
ncbi:hypothetical protein LINGRAHAP2_LOCUS11111 [Linum grandiflorum]